MPRYARMRRGDVSTARKLAKKLRSTAIGKEQTDTVDTIERLCFEVEKLHSERDAARKSNQGSMFGGSK